MGDRKRRDHRDQRPQLPERNHQTQQEEQVINAVEDVPEAQRHEPERGMVPAGIEPDQARVAGETGRPARRRWAEGIGAPWWW